MVDLAHPQLDVQAVRGQFPALCSPWALFDNAGGSVPTKFVIDRVAAYMRNSPVQTGASYPLSQQATAKVAEGHRAAEHLVGAEPGEVVLGPSSTMLLRLLADGMADTLDPGDEIVVTNLDHEANIGPWMRVAARGIKVRIWELNPASGALNLEALDALLTPRTKLVCLTQCANVIGQILDVKSVIDRVHAAGARVCIDGVAYAPHRQVDVKALDADFYVISLYKVYGPHLGMLYGKRDALREVAGQNHSFISEDNIPYKLEPGNVTHELAAALPGILDYFSWVERHHFGEQETEWQARLRRVFGLFAAHEDRLMQPVLELFAAYPDIFRLLGPSDRSQRVPTLAFTVAGHTPQEVAHALQQEQVAIRHGDFYARRAIQALGLGPGGGVARVSMVHYNHPDEVARLVACLRRLVA